MLDVVNCNNSRACPPNLKEWLNYDQSLTDKLKNLSGDAQLELLFQGWQEPTSWDNKKFDLSEKFFQREIFMKSHGVIYWYARTIIPYSCYLIQPEYFSSLEKESVKNLIFNKKEVNLINRIIYPIDEKGIELDWLKNHFPTPENEYWLRWAEFSFLNKSSFYLIEILFSNLGQIK